MTFVILCLTLFLYKLTLNNNNSNNLELKSNQNKLKLPLEKGEFKINNELKFIEDKNTLVNSIKGTNITKGDQQTILLTVLISVNNKCPTDKCINCYINQEIKNPELSDEEAFDKNI